MGATIQETKLSTKSNKILTDESSTPVSEKDTRTISGFKLLTNNQVFKTTSIDFHDTFDSSIRSTFCRPSWPLSSWASLLSFHLVWYSAGVKYIAYPITLTSSLDVISCSTYVPSIRHSTTVYHRYFLSTFNSSRISSNHIPHILLFHNIKKIRVRHSSVR